MRTGIRVGVGALFPAEVILDLTTEGWVCKQILCAVGLISLLLCLQNIGSWVSLQGVQNGWNVGSVWEREKR